MTGQRRCWSSLREACRVGFVAEESQQQYGAGWRERRLMKRSGERVFKRLWPVPKLKSGRRFFSIEGRSWIGRKELKPENNQKIQDGEVNLLN